MLRSASWLLYGEVNRGITSNSWLQVLVMGADATNPLTRPPQGIQSRTEPASVIVEEEILNSRLNAKQALALKTSLLDKGGMTLVSGPPGTGKTKVITSVILCTARMGLKVLVCAGSNTAIDIIANRVHTAFSAAGLSDSEVYRVKGKVSELFPGERPDNQEKSGTTAVAPISEADDVSRINTALYRDLKATLKRIEMENTPTFSLSKRILTTLAAYDGGQLDNPTSKYHERERTLISELSNAIHAPPTLSYPGQEEEMRRKKNRIQDDAWAAVQAFYIEHANVVFSTCANTSSPILRSFRPHICIIDEAGQISEPECLLPLVTFLGTIKGATMVGDVKQLLPTAMSLGRNEFSSQFQMSLFERLIRGGMQSTELNVQYRMHPSICSNPNGMFYGGRLIDADWVKNRPIGGQFEVWARRHESCRVDDRSIFISVSDGELLQERKGTSKVNLANADVVCSVVKSMVKSGGIEPSDILIICYYKAQVRLIGSTLRRSDLASVRVATVDSSQGGESGVVILDTVTPGGEYPLGFVKDPNRLNVALTRARDGLLVIGNCGMGDGQFKTRGSGLLAKLISHHSHQTWNVKGTSALKPEHEAQFGPIRQQRGHRAPPPPMDQRPRRGERHDEREGDSDGEEESTSAFPLRAVEREEPDEDVRIEDQW
jgi:superfamily I DNA and/or RNA helicase